MKIIDRRVTYARTTTIYELETEKEMNTTVEEWKEKLTGPWGGIVRKYGNRLEVANFDD